MYRTSSRPAPLDFLLPSAHSSYDIDRRKDIGLSHPLPQLTPIYFEAPNSGLRTPPADEMATTYQNRQYNLYPNGRGDSSYPPSGASASSYGGSYSGSSMQGRSYSTSNQPASASTLRREVQGSHPLPPQPQSPAPGNRSNTLAPPEDQPRRRSANGDMIRPNLQIPASISEDGGSLAEFAAQVFVKFFIFCDILLTIFRSLVYSGLSPPKPSIRPRACYHLHHRLSDSRERHFLRAASGNGW